MIVVARAHAPARLPFGPQDVIKQLHIETFRGPEYVRRHAGRILTRIFGPIWRAWPLQHAPLPDTPISPEQRAWFHLHPTLPLNADLTADLTAEQSDGQSDGVVLSPEESQEDDDEPG